MMKLQSVSIKGFRGYRDEQVVSIDDLTTIIGRNDVGKSTILEALAIFFKSDSVKLDGGDLCVSSEDNLITIACTFTGLPERVVLDSQVETTLEREHLLNVDGALTIVKTWECSGVKPKEEVYVRAQHPTRENASDLIGMTNAALKTRARSVGVDLASVNQSINSSLRVAIWDTFDNLEKKEVDLPVAKEDMSRIWGKLELLLPLFALFQSDRSSRDSDSEVQDPMKLAIASALSDEVVKEALKGIVDKVAARATELATRTHAALSQIDPDLAEGLNTKFRSEPKWATLFSVALEGADGIAINKRGSGVRRLILVSFFKAEADRKIASGKSENIIYAIEEPETSQHPRNQRLLLEAFRELADTDGCQVILTTHSPGLAGHLPVEGMRFVTKADGAPRVQQGSEEVWEQIADELGVIPDNRVEVLICVEGPTDVDALSDISHVYASGEAGIIDLKTDPRIAFVPMGGGTLTHWVANRYLRKLRKPEFHIYDNDVSSYGKAAEKVNAAEGASRAVLSSKREIENYLDAEAIQAACGVLVEVDDDVDMPKRISDALRADSSLTTLNSTNVKMRLASSAYGSMTVERLDARDTSGDLRHWLAEIEELTKLD